MKNFVLIMFATIALATLANAQSVGCSTKEQCTIYPYTECMEGWCKSPEEPLKPTSLKIIEQETPCTSDSQCGIISCINGVCGGPCQEGGPHPCPGPMPGVHIRKPRLTLPRITTEMFEEHITPDQGARSAPVNEDFYLKLGKGLASPAKLKMPRLNKVAFAAGPVCDNGCSGYDFDGTAGICLFNHFDCANDPQNCGSIGHNCNPNGGSRACDNGSCQTDGPDCDDCHIQPLQDAKRPPKIADSLPGPVPVPQRPRCPVQCQDTAVAEPTICAPERPCPPHSGGRPPIKAATTHSLGGPLPDPTKLNPWSGAIAAAITPPRCPLSGPCKPPVL